MSGNSLPAMIDPDAAIFSISVAAALAEMHPQTLRTYYRMELVVPQRTKGGGRRYSPNDVRRLRLIQRLSQDEGVNLEGIRHILALQSQLDAANQRIAELAQIVRDISMRESRSPRVFTVASSGYIAKGRMRRGPLEISAG